MTSRSSPPDPALEALVAYLRESVQYGLDAQPEFSHADPAGSNVTLPKKLIEHSVEIEEDVDLRRRAQQLLGLGAYRHMLGRDRHHDFALDVGATSWPNVSRTIFPRVIRSLAERILERHRAGDDDPYRWDDCEIFWRVVSLDLERDRYLLRSEYRMTVFADDIVVAQSYDEELAEGICSAFPEVMEIFTPETGGSCEFELAARPAAPGAKWRDLAFHRDRSLMSELLARRPDAKESAVLFYRSESLGPPGRYEVRIQCEWELRFSWNYFLWSAPHNVRLRSFEADLAAFRPAMRGRKVSLLRTTRDERRAEVDQSKLICRLALDDELASGQSIRVEWGSS